MARAKGGDTEPKLIREAFADDDAGWADIRKARATDVSALGPDSTWEKGDRQDRKEAGRPCLAFDELGQYVNQLVNDARETNRAIEVNPAGDETTEAKARFIGAFIRQIEYRSNAQLAYTQMFDDAVSGSYGFLRIVPRYVRSKFRADGPISASAFDQELVILPVPNPDLVTPGYFTRPDLSDCKRVWVHESYTHEEFKAAFPGASRPNLSGAIREVGPTWVDAKRVWVRELWELKTRSKTLVLLPPPRGQREPVAVWVDTIPEAKRKSVLATALKERMVDEPYVCQTITNGIEILKTMEDWPGRYIPIVGCIGKVLWTDSERQILSLIRNALGPQQLYNYYRTSEAELVGMTPKIPWFYYEGALDPKQEQALAESNRVPVGAIKVKPSSQTWPAQHGPLPYPSRAAYEPPIQSMEVGAESTRRSIQSATGTGFLPTEAQRQNQKSGVALREIASSAQKGAYHFVDHYEHSLRRTGEILVDLIPHYYDTARAVHVRGKDDAPIEVRINDDTTPAPQDFGGEPIRLSPEDEFDITLSTGPSYASEREKASDFADQLVAARPEIFAAIGPEIIKLKNLGAIGDKIAELLATLSPPPVQAARNGKQPLPPQAQQAMAQLQQAQQIIQQLQRVIETEQVKGQTQIAIKQLEGEIKLALAQLQGDQKMQQLAAETAAAIDTREDEQQHEMALKGADASQAEASAQRAAAQADLARASGHLTNGSGRPKPSPSER